MEPVIGFVLALLVMLIVGPILIPMLVRLRFGQIVRDDGPQRHLQKTGTPTMGGIGIMIALSIPALILGYDRPVVWMIVLVGLGFAGLGFIDDFRKVVLKRSLGLKAREKLVGQAVLGTLFAYTAIVWANRGTYLEIPLVGSLDLGWAMYLLIILIFMYATNAVNLTDGVDGLCSGTVAISGLVYVLISLMQGDLWIALVAATTTGACLGFLRFNYHPAQVIMGDTGALGLGGVLAALAILTRTEALFLLIGIIYLAEIMSVVIQVYSFRTRGKRIFRMSPIHHHYELVGWSEVRVVWTFWTIAALAGGFALWCIQPWL